MSADGLSLKWNEGDKIGVVYSFVNTGETTYKVVPFEYVGGSEEATKFQASANDIPDGYTQGNYAIYPYHESGFSYDVSDSDGTSITCNFACETDYQKVSLPLLGAKEDNQENVFTFKATGSLLAVKVKNLPAKYTTATLTTREYGTPLQGTMTINTNTGLYSFSKSDDANYSISYTIASDEAADRTFYFPLPAYDVYSYDDTTFTLSGDDVTSTGFSIDYLEVTANQMYTKEITFDENGKRVLDPITQATVDLKTNDEVEADLSTVTKSSGTIYLPKNKSANNDETVKISLKNGNVGSLNYLYLYDTGNEDDSEKAYAKNVEVEIGGNMNSVEASDESSGSSGVYLNLFLSSDQNVKVSGSEDAPISGLSISNAGAVDVDCAVEYGLNVGNCSSLAVNKSVGSTLTLSSPVPEVVINANVSSIALQGFMQNNSMLDITGDMQNNSMVYPTTDINPSLIITFNSYGGDMLNFQCNDDGTVYLAVNNQSGKEIKIRSTSADYGYATIPSGSSAIVAVTGIGNVIVYN
jgi:hypothetical protein